MSTIQGWEGFGIRCSTYEFVGYLQNPGLQSKHNASGWVFMNFKTLPTGKEEKEKILCVLEAATSNLRTKNREYMVQFWAMKEGFLTNVDQPFAVVGSLFKGYCWYKKLCEGFPYSVKEGAEVGGVGRAYLNRNPESSPDLRLYSINEFPLRDEALSCGLRSFLAMPIFNLLKKECYGVLEIVSPQIGLDSTPIFSLVDEGLKKAGLRSTHINSVHNEPKYLPPESEIQKMMKSATELVPQLHLVQVWSPCKQCVNTSNNLSCMQRVAVRNPRFYVNCLMDPQMFHFLHACEFHCLQIGKWIGRPLMSADRKSCFFRNICDFSIRVNPLAHYAQRARLSFCFVVHLQNVHDNNNSHLVEFFFQSKSREDASFLHLLIKIMEKELKNFKFEKSIVELRKTSELTTYEYVEWKQQHSQSEEVNMLTMMKGHTERYSESDFRKYLQTPELSDNKVNNNTGLPNSFIQEKIKKLTMEIVDHLVLKSYSLVQFWAVGMYEDRPCLQVSGQPYTLGSLYKGLAFFRKRCMERHYFVDEEVGPVQRVFKSGHPENSPDLRLYSTTEFPLRDHALHCHLKRYIAFPILDQHKKCIGVLEYVGIDDDDDGVRTIRIIESAFAAVGLVHINFMRDQTLQVYPSRSLAYTEFFSAQKLFKNIPQLFHAEVWVTYNECYSITSNICCTESSFKSKLGWPIPVQTGKGIVGMVLASENKSCFCRNLCHFSIADEPLAHYFQRYSEDVCFAICLRSSHTGNLLYVLQFFLYQGPANYEYLSSFLHILLPILKQELTSFTVASGQQLGDDLVVDVIQFPQHNQFSSELESLSSTFKFKPVLYGLKEPQHSNNELPHFVPNVMDSVPSVPQAKPSNAAASDSIVKGKLGRKRNGNLDIRLEDLPPHFGKNFEHVAEELGGKTIKRACSGEYIKNRSLFEAAGTSQPIHGTNLPPPDISLLTKLPPSTYAKTTLQPVTELQPESETLMVKAAYEDEIIKFKLCLSSTMNYLLEEVAKRLDLEIGSFKLRYLDEDNDKILLACDDDLQLSLKNLTAMNKTNMQLFVQSIRK